jgi:HSP20 family molecular chaperone IbpA
MLALAHTTTTDANSPPPRSATNPQRPQRPEPVRQQSYSKRHASFDTPRTEVPLPFFSEPFPERHLQQRRSESDETTEPPSPGPSLPIPSPTPTSSISQPRPPSPTPPLVRNNSAPTPPSSPLSAAIDVQDLKETESLRDRVEREREREKETPWPSVVPIVPDATTPASREGNIGRRSTASLPLPGDHAGQPLHWLGGPPPTAGPFPTLHPLSSIPAPAVSPFALAPPRPFSLPPPPPPTAPEISTPPTTLHPLLDIPASASSSTSSILNLASAPSPAVSPPQSSAPTTTSASHPSTSTSTTILNPPPSSQPPAATTIATGPQGPHMTVQTTSTAYIITTFLPGYQRDEITLSTRKRRVLHVVADPFLSSSRGTGHFERRISFGYDADMAHIRAEFNGGVLKIVVSRRPTMSVPAGFDSTPGLGGQQGNVWG